MRLMIAALLALSSLPSFAACEGSVLNHKVEKRLLGQPENLCESYQGKVVLVVNTASKCGYTPQYEGLEKLYKTYKDQGLVVLGFPSDQFNNQEYGDDAKIAAFCKANYGVSFPMFAKSNVLGDDANALFKDLITITGQKPGWNFNKYLISRDGKSVVHYDSDTKPEGRALIQAIEAQLAKTGG